MVGWMLGVNIGKMKQLWNTKYDPGVFVLYLWRMS